MSARIATGTVGISLLMLAGIALPPATLAQQFKLTLPFNRPAPGQPQQPQNAQTDAAQFQWRPDVKASVDAFRASNCVTSTAGRLGHVSRGMDDLTDDVSAGMFRGNERQRGADLTQADVDRDNALKRVAWASNPSFQDVDLAVGQICSVASISKGLEEWTGGGLVASSINPPPMNQPTYQMPVQVACYADNSTIEAFLHQIPLNILSVPGTRNTRAEIPEDFRRSRLPGVLANTATALQAPCRDWFTRIYFRPYYAQQEQITKSVTKIRAIWMATGVAPVDQVVWEGRSADSNTAEREPYKDIELFANELNIAIENRLKPLAANLSFTPPTKGEFEKTADYDVRVHNAHEAFTAAQDSNAAAVRSSIMQARNQVFNAFLGSPTISESKYDADKEMLTIGITSPKSPFRVTATIAIPPEEARTLVPTLASIAPHVLLSVAQGEATVRALVVWAGDKVYPGTVSDFTKMPIKFGSDAAAQWPKTLADRQEVQRRQQALRQQAEAARIQEEARSNPRLAFALQRAQSGDPRCAAIWSNAVAIARQPGISDSTFNQVVAKLEATADRVGCP